MKKIVLILLFSVFISIPVVLPFFLGGYFPTHDGEWAVVRLSDMFRTIRDFQIPPRYSGALNFGYGYPLFNFTYPMPYYIGTLMHFLGIGFVDTIKILFALSVPLSAFFMFLASRRLWKNTWTGVVSSVFYIYFPYRMVDLYVRGSIGESLSFVLFPLLFYFAIRLVEKPAYMWILGVAMSLAILVTTHNIMTVLFLPVWILFIVSKLILDKNKDSIKPIATSIILGIGLSAFFWIPAIFEKHLILLSQTPIADRSLYFVKLSQLLLPGWGFGIPTDPNGFTYQLGLAHFIVLFLAAFVLFFIWRRKTKRKSALTKFSFLLISIILVLIFLMTKPSAFFWENLPLLSEINYPWTVLAILGFLTSLLAGFLCGQKTTKYIAAALSLIAVVLVLPYAKPQYYVDRGDNFYLTNDATTTSSNELMPLWVKEMPRERAVEKIEINNGQGKVENVFYNSKQVSFSVDLLSQSTVRINTIYYPGWMAIVYPLSCHPEASAEGSHETLRFAQNDSGSKCAKDMVINYNNEKGVMEFNLPKGQYNAELNFIETSLRATSNTISLLSLVAVLFLGIKSLRKSSSV